MTRLNVGLRKWIVGIIAAALIITCSLLLVPQERLLMRDANKITAINIGTLAPNRVQFSPCLWRSDHAVIVMTYRADGDRFEFVEVDADTGVQKPLTIVNNKCRVDLLNVYLNPRSGRILPPGVHMLPRIQVDPPFYSVSPDGQRVIFAHWNVPRPFPYTAIKIDGNEETHWRSSEAWTRSLWMADSHRWLEPVYEGDLTKAILLHDTRKPEQNTRILIPGADGGGFALGITKQERLLGFVRNSGQPVVSEHMIDCDFLSPAPTPHKYAVRLPKVSTVRGVRLSTKRDRLAWMLLYDNTPTLSQWLHKMVPRIPFHPQPTIGLWESRLDGTNMTEIGHTAATNGATKIGYGFQWLPGDKKVSFIYKDSLYTVPVP